MGSLDLNPLFVCVYIFDFPAQARLRNRPELSRSCVVVLEGEPPAECVCSISKHASLAGVTYGTTRAQLDAFENVVVLRKSEAEEDAARKALLSVASTFTPRTQIFSDLKSQSTFVMVLDITGTTRLFGEPVQTVQKIQRAVQSIGFAPRLGASRNFHVAVCVAAYASNTPQLISAGDERQALAKLPITALGITDEQKNTFDIWGIRSVGEFAELPEAELISRLGQQGKHMLEKARGIYPHLFIPEEPAFALAEYIAFDTPQENLESLLFVLSPMLNQLIRRARAHAYALASIKITLTLDGAPDHVRVIRPSSPLAEHSALLKLLQLDLEAHPPEAQIVSIHLDAEPGERNPAQTGLFSPQLPEPSRLDETLARIAALVGEERVGSVMLLDTHRPEAFVMQKFAVPRDVFTLPSKLNVSLRRFRPRVSLNVLLSANRPVAFYFESKRYTVTEAYGPWRRSGDWWSASVWSQDEWDVRADSASGEFLLGLLAHDLLRKTWQLVALYD